MKFMCLGYFQDDKWEAMKGEQGAMVDQSMVYEDKLRAQGIWLDGGQALQSARKAKTLRWNGEKVVVTDGPFAETKGQLGGVGILEARDMEHAVDIMSKHPCIRFGATFEIRPIDEESLKRQQEWNARLPQEESAASHALAADLQRFACLGYHRSDAWFSLPEEEKLAKILSCIEYDNARRRSGQWVTGLALQSAHTAKSLRAKSGQIVITDGPFAETKEQLGGLVVIRAKDMEAAVASLAQHPGLTFGVAIEIRPIDEAFKAMVAARCEHLQNAGT